MGRGDKGSSVAESKWREDAPSSARRSAELADILRVVFEDNAAREEVCSLCNGTGIAGYGEDAGGCDACGGVGRYEADDFAAGWRAVAAEVDALLKVVATPADEQIKHMVDRFLMWRLPSDFSPDCGIHFDAEAARKLNPANAIYQPVGTNLLNASQARQMVDFMLAGLPRPSSEAPPLGAERSDATDASRDEQSLSSARGEKE